MRDYAEAAGDHIDLSDAMRRAETFRASALALRQRVAGGDARQAERLTALHLRLSRLLNPVLFTILGPYEFDPALQMPVLPGLARVAEVPGLSGGDAYEFLRTELVRQRNRIADTLQTAIEAIDAVLRPS